MEVSVVVVGVVQLPMYMLIYMSLDYVRQTNRQAHEVMNNLSSKIRLSVI